MTVRQHRLLMAYLIVVVALVILATAEAEASRPAPLMDGRTGFVTEAAVSEADRDAVGARATGDRGSTDPDDAGGIPPAADQSAALSGEARWYCNADAGRGPRSRCTRDHPDAGGDQLLAAIHRDLLHLRGDRVLVCRAGTDACVTVRIVDCQCGGSTLVDLYADAFARLAPLGRGVIDVMVVLPDGPRPTPPATDTR